MDNNILLKAVCLSLSWGSVMALAQEASFPEVPGCMRQNSSRLPAPECGFDVKSPILINNELEFSTTLATPALVSRQCQARVTIDYSQRNTIARVNGKLENDKCAASSGSFIISARIRDADNEVQTLEFHETWRREDNEPVLIGGDYTIGEDVYLLRVNAGKVQCRCTPVDSE